MWFHYYIKISFFDPLVDSGSENLILIRLRALMQGYLLTMQEKFYFEMFVYQLLILCKENSAEYGRYTSACRRHITHHLLYNTLLFVILILISIPFLLPNLIMQRTVPHRYTCKTLICTMQISGILFIYLPPIYPCNINEPMQLTAL